MLAHPRKVCRIKFEVHILGLIENGLTPSIFHINFKRPLDGAVVQNEKLKVRPSSLTQDLSFATILDSLGPPSAEKNLMDWQPLLTAL